MSIQSSVSTLLSGLSSDDLFAILISVVALAGTTVSIIADTYKIKATRIHLQKEINKDNNEINRDNAIITRNHLQ